MSRVFLCFVCSILPHGHMLELESGAYGFVLSSSPRRSTLFGRQDIAAASFPPTVGGKGPGGAALLDRALLYELLGSASDDNLDWDPKSAPKLDFNEDYYSLLEVKPTADSRELKKAYYQMVFRYHPGEILCYTFSFSCSMSRSL